MKPRLLQSSVHRATAKFALVCVIVAVLVQTCVVGGDELVQNSAFASASNSTVSGSRVSDNSQKEYFDASEYHAVRRLSAHVVNGLNDVLRPVVVVLPKVDTLKLPFVFGDIRIELSELECKDVSIGSVQVASSGTSSSTLELELKLTGLHLTCTSNWAYKWWFFKGDGSVRLDGSRGRTLMQAKITLESKSDGSFPTKSTMTSCAPGLDVDVSFDGGIVSDIANLFKSSVDDALENQVKSLVCDELDDFANGYLTAAILGAGDALSPYTVCDSGQNDIILHDSTTYRQCIMPQNFTVADVVSVEEALEFEVDQEALNLNNSFVSFLTSSLQSYLGGNSSESLLNDTKHSDLGINIALRDLGVHGEFSLNMSIPLVQSTAFSLLLTRVVIEGLDSFQNITSIAAISNWTLGYGFNLREIKASIELHAAVEASGSYGTPNGQELHVNNLAVNDAFNVTFGVSGLGFDLAHLLAIDINSTRQLTLGQVLAAPLACAWQSVIALNFSKIFITVSRGLQLEVDSLIGVEVDSLINGLVEAVYEKYEAPILTAITNYAKTTGVDTINSLALNALDEYIANMSQVCPSPRNTTAAPDFLNFNQSESFAQFMDLFERFVGQSEPEPINQLIGSLTEGLNPEGVAGAIEVDKVFEIDGQMEEYGHINLSMTGFRIIGLNTLSELSLLQPTSNYSTHFLLALGNVSGKFNELRVQVSVDLRTAGGSLGNQRSNFTFSASLSFMRVFLDVFAEIDQARLEALRLEQMIVPDCLLATFRTGGLSIRNAQLVLKGLRFGLTCSECDNPYLHELSQTWNEEDSVELDELTSRLLASISSSLEGSRVQRVIDELITGATIRCASKVPDESFPEEWAEGALSLWTWLKGHELEGVGSQLNVRTAVFFLMAVVGSLLACSCSACRGCICRRRAAEVKTIDASSAKKQSQRQALLLDSHIPFAARFLVVFLLLCALIMFFLGHVLMAVTMGIKVSLLGFDISLSDVYPLNVIKGINKAWQAKAYAISLALLLVSVMWAYIRNVSMILLWCIPTTLVPSDRRGCILEWLDSFAKWSMLDIYTFVFLIMATHLKLSSPARFQMLPPGLYDAELLTSPQMGMSCNIIAQIISQIVAHVEIYYHRRVVNIERESLIVASKYAERSVNEPSNPELCETSHGNATHVGVGAVPSASVGSDLQSVCRHALAFRIKDRHSLAICIIAHALVLAALIFGVILMWVGMFLPIFSITNTGIVGLLKDAAVSGSRTTLYSFYDFVRESQLVLLTIVLAVCTIVVPSVQAVFHAILWSWPLTWRNLERLKFTSQLISAWSFPEVFLVAVYISAVNTQQLAWGVAWSFGMVLGYDKLIADTLALLQDIGLISAGDGALFGVSVGLESGAYVLMLAAILLNCVGVFVNSRVSERLMQS